MASYFGLEIKFGSSYDRVSFESDAKSLPVVTADPHLSSFLISYHEEALKRRPAALSLLRTQVENTLTRLLPHGTGDIVNVARELGTSSRTLTRRLAEEDQTFRAILNEMRAELSAEYLANECLSISEIAWLLGYRDRDAFGRAHREWTGQTPAQQRRKLTASP